MATSDLAYNLNNGSDTLFRAWVAQFIAQMIAISWVQTADTGQINTATVTAPTGGNQSKGYAMFRANDGVSPELYLRVDFGSSVNGAAPPAIWVMVGFSTDGAGNLGTQRSHQYRLMSTNSGTAPGTAVIRLAKSADIASIAFNATYVGSNNPCYMAFSVERYRNASGVVQTTGAAVYAGSVDTANVRDNTAVADSQFWLEAVPSSGGAGAGPVANNRLPQTSPSTTSSFSWGDKLSVGLLLPWGAPKHMIGTVLCSTGDFPLWGLEFDYTLMGVQRHYKYQPARSENSLVNGYTAFLWQ